MRRAEIYLEQLKRTPTLDVAARIGDLHAARGDAEQSEHYYQLAEDLDGPGVVQTEATLALYLADHDRKVSDAVTIAEAVAVKRRDIFTEDALAWAALLQLVRCREIASTEAFSIDEITETF